MSSPFSLLLNTAQPQEPTSLPNKKTKARPKKKIPQRGMGVPQLERLRLQELHKSTQQQPQQLDFYYPSLNLNPQPAPLPMPEPLHYGTPLNFYVNGVIGSGQVLAGNYNPYCVDAHIRNSNYSRELPSLPNVYMHQHHSSYSDLCFKKKMVMNGDQNLGHNGRRNNLLPTNAPDFLAFNQDNNITLNTNNTIGSFTSRAPTNAIHANHNPKGKNVVAVHRKGNTRGGRGGFFVEYEFFPRSKTSDINYGTMTSTASKEWEFLGSSEEASVPVGSGVGGGEASCVTLCDHSSLHTSNSIDLSLRLSC